VGPEGGTAALTQWKKKKSNKIESNQVDQETNKKKKNKQKKKKNLKRMGNRRRGKTKIERNGKRGKGPLFRPTRDKKKRKRKNLKSGLEACRLKEIAGARRKGPISVKRKKKANIENQK